VTTRTGGGRPFARAPIELSATQFESLAAGYGDTGALGVLLTGQRSLRRLLLLAVAGAARDAQLCAAAGVDDALAVLAAADRAAPAAAGRVLGHPLAGAWATRCLRHLRRGGQDRERMTAGLGYLAALGVAAGTAARIDFELDIPTSGNALFLPTLGTMRGAGRGRVTVRGTGGVVTIDSAAGPLLVATGQRDDPDRWLPVRTVSAEHEGLRLQLTIEDGDPYRDGYRPRPADRLADADVARLEDVLADAWSWLVAQLPGHALATSTILRSVVPLCPNAGQHPHISATSRAAFGSIAMAIPADARTLALSLVHEVQHAKLGAILDILDLYRDAAGSRFRAPWRMDPRPVGALLQGTYAHLAVAGFWRARAAGDDNARQTREARLASAYWRRQVGEALAVLAASQQLLPLGEQFVAGMAATLELWDCDPTTPDLDEVVSDTTVAGAVAWRLRNFRPAPVEVTELVRAWRSGAPCPAVAAARIADAEPAVAEEELFARLRFTSSVPSDSRTVIEHLEQIRLEPADDRAWCALAVALHRDGRQPAAAALTARPDLVREIYRNIEPPSCTPSPIAVAEWLAGAHGGVGSM